MNRGANGKRLARWIVATTLLVLAVATMPIVAASTTDDRPTLVASQQVPAGQAAADRLTTVSVATPSTGNYDVVLTGDGSLPYEVFTLDNPHRIVFDLPGVTAATARTRYEVDDRGLVRVRVGQYRSDPEPMARVVMELTGDLDWTAEQTSDGVRIHLGQPTVERSATATTPAASETKLAMNATQTAFDTTADEAKQGAEQTIQVAVASEQPGATSTPAVERPAPRAASEQSASATRPTPSTTTLTTTTPETTTTTTTPETTGAALDDATPRPTAQQDSGAQPTPAASTSAYEAELQAIAQEAAAKTTRPPARPARIAPAQTESPAPLPSFETKTIEDGRRSFNGRPISLNLVDADIKQVFSVFHDISGLNFVLDPAVAGAVTIVVDNVPWDQALDLILKNNSLDMVLEGNVVRVAPVSKLAQEASARKALIEAKEFESAPVSITRTLSYANAKEIEKVVRDAILSPKGRVVVDERTNTLIIRDIPTRIDAIDRLLTTLDAETPQVMIEARIVEISRDFVRDLGIKWGFTAIADPSKGTQTNLDFPHHGRIDYDLNLPKNPSASSLGFSFGNVLDSFTLDITLDALETEGYAKRLSSPKIATQNNEPAEIEQGVRIPIVSTTATEIDVRFVSASLRLKTTPQITAEGTVVLDVEVENNSPDFVNTVGDVPAINTQRAQTKVLIADGGTTVIGGIYSVNEGKSDSGVPWLKNIPGLGWLFKSRNIQQRNRELLIFITPRIIKAS